MVIRMRSIGQPSRLASASADMGLAARTVSRSRLSLSGGSGREGACSTAPLSWSAMIDCHSRRPLARRAVCWRARIRPPRMVGSWSEASCPGLTMPRACRMSSTVSMRVAPSRIRWWQPWESGLWMEPGTAITSRPSSAACRAVISEPLRRAASTTRVPRESAAIIRLRRGKLARTGALPRGCSLSTSPPCSSTRRARGR